MTCCNSRFAHPQPSETSRSPSRLALAYRMCTRIWRSSDASRTSVTVNAYSNDLPFPKSGFALDIGGEGRYPKAWNLNPSRVKTIGVDLGTPIPRLILGRAESIPLPTQSVDLVIVERTPLKTAAFEEIKRIILCNATVVLRHAVPPNLDPHRSAYGHFSKCRVRQTNVWRRGYWLQETVLLSMHSPAGRCLSATAEP